MLPEWLPSELIIRGGSLAADYETLYSIFTKEIREAELSIEGVPIIVDTTIDPDFPDYERGFLHLVTRETSDGMRTIDYDRAKKLHWIPHVIRNYTEPEVNAFWYDAPKGSTLCLWLPDLDHVTILKWTSKSQRRKVIVTAYSVDRQNRRHFEKLFGRATRIL